MVWLDSHGFYPCIWITEHNYHNCWSLWNFLCIIFLKPMFKSWVFIGHLYDDGEEVVQWGVRDAALTYIAHMLCLCTYRDITFLILKASLQIIRYPVGPTMTFTQQNDLLHRFGIELMILDLQPLEGYPWVIIIYHQYRSHYQCYKYKSDNDEGGLDWCFILHCLSWWIL